MATATESGGRTPAAVVAAGVVTSVMPNLLKAPSPRYAGGPLMGTVQDFMNRIAGGDTQALLELDQLRKTDKHAGAWQAVWVNELPKIALSPAHVLLVRSSDPALAARLNARASGSSVVLPEPELAGMSLTEKVLSFVQRPSPDSAAPPGFLGVQLDVKYVVFGGLALAAVLAVVLVARRS